MKRSREVIVRPHKLGKEERDKGRTKMTLMFLWRLMGEARSHLDVRRWINEGGLDAEEFLECLESGREHPLLGRWRVKKTIAANRTAPTSRERAARRIVVLAVVALQRVVSMTGDEARRTVAAAMSKLFEDVPTAEIIHHWQRQQEPTTPANEKLLATVIASTHGDPTAVVEHFVQMAHTVLTPAPFLKPEARQELLTEK
jgi:hypothetical protein